MEFNKKKRRVVKQEIVNVSKSGRLFIKTSDFLNQGKIQKTIEELLNSEIVKGIENEKEVKV